MPTSKSEEKIDFILRLLQSQRTFQEAMNIRMTNLETQIAQVGKTAKNTLQYFTRRSLKLDMPRFDGSKPLAWIFKIKQFFDYHRTPNDQRLQLVSFSMEGETLACLRGSFRKDFHKEALFKLCQTSTVRGYQYFFELLANRTVGLPPSSLVASFQDSKRGAGISTDLSRKQ
ncbi:hypothetical protein PHAVU_003G172600 [Phaseolus vulgaris]|uniref:Retrotransposon gag domain-containing protein n=1 Tax=Phaseolus vulgaris TaxID=3885 RepID=V7CCK9_PHAVU|nr:hypothetical protein PHAVU_003G172600g [Phaseolus vulgaris]ESW27088.1 hypothetical protein PHAVU_003G172600g [Phaseolus vulgaris]